MGPDLSEGTFPDISEGMSPRELIGVDVTLGVHGGEGDARLISSVPFEEGIDLFGSIGIGFQEVEVEISVIGVVVDGEQVEVEAVFVEVSGLVEEEVEDLSGLLRPQVEPTQFFSPTGIGEVVDAASGNSFGFHESEDGGEFVDVFRVDREAETNAYAAVSDASDAFEGFFEGASNAADAIVDGSDAIETDADVGESHFADAIGGSVVDERAVGGEHGAKTPMTRIGDDLKQIGSQEWFAAGKENGGHSERGKVFHEVEGFCGRQFAGIFLVFRVGVAVDASEVASLGAVPDDDGFFVLRVVEQMSGTFGCGSTIAEGIAGGHCAVDETGNSYHGGFP